MSTPDVQDNRFVTIAKAVVAFAGTVRVSKQVHRGVTIVAALAVATATFVGDNAILLNLSPEKAVYIAVAASVVTTLARIFQPED